MRPTDLPEAGRRNWGRADALALLALAVALGILYAQTLFTNLAPAGGDALFYFIPYWDYVNEALRAARLPQWNPFMYAGAPLLANPQTQVFYPLRWLFLPFAAEKGIVYAAVLHAWLSGAFTYALMRRAGRVGPLAGFTAALIFMLGGWTTGLLAQPNRWSTIPWLPAALFLWECLPWNDGGFSLRQRRTRGLVIALIGVWALALLAGHTQTFYNQAVIFAAWVAAPVIWQVVQALRQRRAGLITLALRAAWLRLLVLILIFGAAVLLSAVQVLPTLELSGFSYRSGGMAFRDHAALSLKPWQAGLALLPHYARDLGRALASDAYAEWVAYVGLVGLALAGMGLGAGPKRFRWSAVALVGTGLFLAVGLYNPAEYVLFRLVPGWNLFRVPARWLEATALGLALLAGLGIERLGQGWRPSCGNAWVATWPRRLAAIALTMIGLALVLVARPNGPTLLAWAMTLTVMALLLRRRFALTTTVLVLALFLELYAASWGLAVQHPTAPQAVRSWRTAPARIAAESDPFCRTVSLSGITWDAGDLADLERIYGPHLSPPALRDLITATKAKEVLAPNLALLFRLPSLDGYDGGVLPTRFFAQAMKLFLPADRVVADGRLREQLREVPPARLLSPFNVCYVIADKNFDVWHNDVYYDLAFGETLNAVQPELELSAQPDFPVTHLGLVSHLQGGAALTNGAAVAEVVVAFAGGQIQRLPLAAGVDTAEGSDAVLDLRHRRDLPAVRWRYDAPGQDFITELPLALSGSQPSFAQLRSIRIELLRPDVALFVRGVAIIDGASGAHSTIPVSRQPWQRIHSGDVKIYRNGAAFPRAWLVPTAELSPSDDATLAHMQNPDFQADRVALLAEGEPGAGGGTGRAEVTMLDPEHVRITFEANAASTLLLAEAWYPGWRATLDPQGNATPVPIWRADLLLRAIPVPAGRHEILLEFRPRLLRLGVFVSATTLILLLIALLWSRVLPPSRRDL